MGTNTSDIELRPQRHGMRASTLDANAQTSLPIEKAVMMIMSIEDHIGIGDPLKEGDIQVKVEGHLIKEDIQIEDLLGEDIPIEMEGLPEGEDILGRTP